MPDNVIVSVDVMGGDDAPEVVIEGIEHYRKSDNSHARLRFLLHGNGPQIEVLLKDAPETAKVSQICHTEKTISMEEKPSTAVRKGRGSSMWNAIDSVKKGEAKVALSAGNTGALLGISNLLLRTKEGVDRPAIAASWPRTDGNCVMLDLGANIECDDRQLAEFAVLGEAFYRALYHKEKPSVGLLNVGTEGQKGNAVVRAADMLLREARLGLDYVGFVEGNDISMGDVDVIVTDGWSGNIALKSAEGTARLVESFIREAFSGWLGKLSGLLNIVGLRRMKSRMDPRKVNGGVFLGLNGVVVKSHGGTDKIGYANAIEVAVEMAYSDFEKEIERSLTALHDAEDTVG